MSARFAHRKGILSQPQLDAAMLPLKPMLDRDRARPQLYQTIAEIHELRATWLMAVTRTPPGRSGEAPRWPTRPSRETRTLPPRTP